MDEGQGSSPSTSTGLEDNELNGFTDTLIHALEEFSGQEKTTRRIIKIIDDFTKDMSTTLTSDEKWPPILEIVFKFLTTEPYIYLEFTLTACTCFLRDKSFQTALYECLCERVADTMIIRGSGAESESEVEERTRRKNFCQFIARVLTNDWPAELRNCTKNRNVLLFTAISAVYTWTDKLEEILAKDEEDDAQEQDVAMMELCSYCLLKIVQFTGRKFWLKWLDLVDKVYTIIKLVLINNRRHVSEELKARLLDAYVKIGEWSKRPLASNVKTRDAFTQTYSQTSGTYKQYTSPNFSQRQNGNFSHYKNSRGSYQPRKNT